MISPLRYPASHPSSIRLKTYSLSPSALSVSKFSASWVISFITFVNWIKTHISLNRVLLVSSWRTSVRHFRYKLSQINCQEALKTSIELEALEIFRYELCAGRQQRSGSYPSRSRLDLQRGDHHHTGPISKCTAYPHSHLCGLQLRCTSERNTPFLDPCRENVFPSAGREEAGLVEECHAACRQPTRASAEAGWNEIAI